MPRGGPDGNVSTFSYAAQAVDPGLIYQMLWGFSPVDGLGRPVYLDTFNNGLNGVGFTTIGAGAQPKLISTPLSRLIYSPPNCVKLTPGVVLNDKTDLYREFYLGTNARLGMEAAFVMGSATPGYRIAIDYSYDPSHRYFARIFFNHASGSWQVATPSGFVDFFTPGVPPASTILHMQVKFVGDWSTGKYVRALIGDNLFDLSSYSMPVSGIGYDGQVIISAGAFSYGAGTGDGYVGYMLFTRDEPA